MRLLTGPFISLPGPTNWILCSTVKLLIPQCGFCGGLTTTNHVITWTNLIPYWFQPQLKYCAIPGLCIPGHRGFGVCVALRIKGYWQIFANSLTATYLVNVLLLPSIEISIPIITRQFWLYTVATAVVNYRYTALLDRTRYWLTGTGSVKINIGCNQLELARCNTLCCNYQISNNIDMLSLVDGGAPGTSKIRGYTAI